MEFVQSRRLKVEVRGLRHCQQIRNALLPLRKFFVFLNRQQHMRGTATVGDEHGTPALFALLVS